MLVRRSVLKRSERVPLSTAALAILGLLLFRVIERQAIYKARQEAEQAQLAVSSIEELLNAVLNAETGQRGFLLTGAKRYLTPYEQAVQEIPRLLLAIRRNSANITHGPQLAAALEHSVQAKINELALTIALYQRAQNTALEIVKTNRGNEFMTQVRINSRILQDAHFRAFIEQSQYSDRFSLIGAGIELLLGSSVLVLLFLGTKRLNASRRSEEALKEDYQLLTGKLQLMREEERARLARDIHDDLGQVLTGLKMDISMISRRLVSNDPGAALQKLGEASSSVDNAIQSVRRLAKQLRPAVLDQLGLIAALQSQAREFESRLGILVCVTTPKQELPLNQDQRTAFFRIAQEALTNVARHARAKSVRVRVVSTCDHIELVIDDDGIGMPSNPRRGSLGLLGMQERAKLIGAEFQVTSGEHGGTAVRVSLPIESCVRREVSVRL